MISDSTTKTIKTTDNESNEILPIAMVYRIENLKNNLRYYGITTNVKKRWIAHVNPSINSKHYLANALRKMIEEEPTLKFEWLSEIEGLYGFFRFKVVQLYKDSVTRKTLNQIEIQYISFFDTFNGYGYNCTPGGDGVSEWTEEMRVNISITRKKKYKMEKDNDPDYTRNKAQEQGCREFIAVNLKTGEYRYQCDGRPWLSHKECSEHIFSKKGVRIGNAFRDSKYSGRAKNPLLRVGEWCFIYVDDQDKISKAWIKNAKKSFEDENRKFKVYKVLTGEYIGEYSNQRECARKLNLGKNSGNMSNMLNGNNDKIKHVKGHILIWSHNASPLKIDELLVSARKVLYSGSLP